MKLIFLSNDFYNDYGGHPEILKKHNRPYACLAVKIDGKIFAIPFRHNITHNHAFITFDKCGLDYTKAVPILKKEYISSAPVIIDQKEYNLIKSKEKIIIKGLSNYISLYKKALKYSTSPHYKNIIQYSALNAFQIK